ncbi:IQ and AAA domain-containing protein 1 [Cimex lectularius]|uniref:ATPase AAA-type core domain-containing protein n=1 Tax=Cimex lectularius TaxID=79782 RepID=A0A8I6SR35_CIMLE|nr:IQ and AAA domain-containing protein 1 [Cimex lectularius]
MSHTTYKKIWADAQAILDEATKVDVEQQSTKPTRDRDHARKVVGTLYLKYIQSVNKLDECYDQIVQPQKRLLVRRLLDASIGRFLELKHELVNIDMSEFSYFDDIMLEEKLLPQEVEVCVPTYFRRERETVIKERRQTIDRIMRELGFYEDDATGIIMTEEKAISLIQAHERARQGRLRAQFMKEIRSLKDKIKTEPKEDELEENSKRAALKIQKIWRGYITRRKIKKRVMEEMLLIGMLPGAYTSTEERQRAEEVKNIRRQLQEERETEYQKALAVEKENIKKNEGPVMIEEMGDEVRAWFMGYKEQTGKFPDLPSEEAGGSALIFSRQGAESERSKSTAPSSKESKKGSKGRKSAKEKEEVKKRPEEEEDPGFKMAPSNFLAELMVACSEYDERWKGMDEAANPMQTHYADLIKKEKKAEVEAELRKIVDDQLRAELEALQAALDRDRARKGKKAKKAAKKKSRRGGKKGKKKKEKDLTPDRTTESLFEELVTHGIIRKYPEVSISSFLGERSYANHELRSRGLDPLPSLGDIRQVILEYCILPLGSPHAHKNSPLVRSILLAGPQGSGKRLLVNAICTETGATLFDLSPANIVGKYPGKSGLVMLLHLVSKVSRLLQPSVILIDSAEKTFMKKVPKTDKTDPKRLKKDLAKLVKGIGPDDQVLVIGTSRLPWECDQKLLVQAYHKLIFVPRPDYASLSLLWNDQLFQYAGLSRQFNTSSLARLADGYTVGSILAAIKDVLTCKRVLQLRMHQLTHAEIINVLCKREPVYREEEEEFLNWYSKTPIGRKKQRALELEAERIKEMESMQKKK